MKRNLLHLIFSIILTLLVTRVHGQSNYVNYHNAVIRCESYIAEERYEEAIAGFDSIFSDYDFVFLRDCKVATQLCAYLKNSNSGMRFLRVGISNGWTLESIENDEKLIFLRENPQWASLQAEYELLHQKYIEGLNTPLKQQVHEMYKRDQKKALGVLLRIGQKAQRKYAEKRFAPHSEKQLAQLNKILDKWGYPGERLIGNSWWVSVILSHHNSISETYNRKDTLYMGLKQKLISALKKGELSPYTLATIEDWRTAALNGHQLTSYGFLGAIPNDSIQDVVNKNRAEIGIRSIELRNSLIDVEKETGMNLYLPKDWQEGKVGLVNTKE